MEITFAEITDFISHPGFQLYNMIINAQIQKFRDNLEAINAINPITKVKYTENEYEVMRRMINNLREIQNAPAIELQERAYELEIAEQEILEKIREWVEATIAKKPVKKSFKIKKPN